MVNVRALYAVAVSAAIAGSLLFGTVYADPPRPNENAEKNVEQTGCNANNPEHGCPRGAGGDGRDDGRGAVCGNGNHTNNPHCEDVSDQPPPPVQLQPTPVSQPTTASVVNETPRPDNPVPDNSTPPSSTPEVLSSSVVTLTAPTSLPVVLGATPVALPKAGDPLPAGMGLLGGLGLLIAGWKIWRP